MRPLGVSILPTKGVLTPDLIAAIQRTAGNSGVAHLLESQAREHYEQKNVLSTESCAGVQRTAEFTLHGQSLNTLGVEAKFVCELLRARIVELGILVPADWWLDENNKGAGLRPALIEGALRELVSAKEDYGEFNLDTTKGITTLCQELIKFSSGASKNSSSSPKGELASSWATAPTPIISVPSLAAGGRGVQQPMKMEAVFLTSGGFPGIYKEIEEWKAYTKNLREPLAYAFGKLQSQRRDLGNDYYSPQHNDFRIEFKEAKRRCIHMDGVEQECDTVLAALRQAFNQREPLDRFAALYANGRLQGIVEWKSQKSRDADYISNIVGSPYNIVPAGEPVVGGVAKALLILTVARHRAERAQSTSQEQAPSPIRLWALNNKVKGIYDRYYFRVFDGPKGLVIDRPPRGKKDTKAVELGKNLLVPKKTQWHYTKTMILTDEMAKKLVAEAEPKKWLTIPSELARFLDDVSG